MFSDPEKNIAELHLREGMVVADLGAGTGAYATAAARAVGQSGTVYAVEVQKELLSKIKNAAADKGLENVEVLWGDIEEEGGAKIGDRAADAVVLSNVLFQAENKAGLLKEAARVVKSGGVLLVVDWSGSFGGLGPHADQVVGESDAKHLAVEAGFVFQRNINAGAHHYGMIFKKS